MKFDFGHIAAEHERLKNRISDLEAELAAIRNAPIAGYAHQGTCHYRKHKPEDGYGWVALIRKPEGL